MLKICKFIIYLTFFISTQIFANSPSKFISIADIHFNPFIGCNQLSTPCPLITELQTTNTQSWNTIFQKYSKNITTQYHQDTDYNLLQSILTELKALDQQEAPNFILILGDFLAHNFQNDYKNYSGDTSSTGYQAFVKKTLEYLTTQLNTAAPATHIYPALGNNDTYGKNYNVQPQGQFLQDTAEIFAPLIKNKIDETEFRQQFQAGGYYAMILNQSNQRLIILNSVLFNPWFPTKSMTNAATLELTWLQTQLKEAHDHQQTVLIAMHIPPGVDVYESLQWYTKLIKWFYPPTFWQNKYNSEFISILQQYATVITGILPAHIHNDSFQLIATSTPSSYLPISFTPSISPVYGNNPGLKIYSYDPDTFQLINFDTYYYPLNEVNPTWQFEYNFNAVYQPDCQTCSLVNGMLRLTKDNSLVDSYKKYFAVNRNAQPITKQNTWLPYYWCGIYNLDWASYLGCLKK